MIQTLVDRPGEREPEAVHEAYLEALRDAVESAGVDAVVAESGLDRERIETLRAGEPVELTVSEAGAILGAAEGIDGEAIAAEARDELLLGMTTAVLDVDTVAANLGDVDPKEIQQRLEGRAALPLAEYARLHAFIAGRQR